MIRLFKVYYPMRTLLLLGGEALIASLSFVVGTSLSLLAGTIITGPDSSLSLRLNNELFIEGGYIKIVAMTAVVLLLSHGFDLYDSGKLSSNWDQAFRMLLVLGLLAFCLAGVEVVYHNLLHGHDPVFFPGAVWGLTVLTFMLFGWRLAHGWIVQQPFFRERVYVLGTGDRAQRLLDGLRQRTELGVEVVGWTGNILGGEFTRETVGSHLLAIAREKGVHRVIVAMPDRRLTLPVEELLDLRLAGVKVEEATSWLEKISGRIEVEQLYPSWLIFADGFSFGTGLSVLRHSFSMLVAAIALLLTLPLFPFIMLAIKIDSPGQIFYQQKRVGRAGTIFHCYKFRTMRKDAEADTGATWATDDDPRITRVGRFLRTSRLDELPQLWCVLKGDMSFVGPRPERPEFVELLSKEIPYYGVRHVVRPGITGWAQVEYKYGNTMKDAREKLQYDLFYIKNASLGLDLLILFQTIKIVLLGRGAK
ncbi:MAG TPA: TIGR03013 family XrtA/PEP-CTERM system glycosyltransferase [Candidatus Sulfotelmatobacter sp.]|nr:TIGR03013 family XrtA/PEP-CTERM system glycosyltransferase [Candidatus Sulfotelmatobacter sp.]